MRKLKLESLQVETFSTTDAGTLVRGTVDGHGDSPPSTQTCPIDSYDVAGCVLTEGLECTYGCSWNCSRETNCRDRCWVEEPTWDCP